MRNTKAIEMPTDNFIAHKGTTEFAQLNREIDLALEEWQENKRNERHESPRDRPTHIHLDQAAIS